MMSSNFETHDDAARVSAVPGIGTQATVKLRSHFQDSRKQKKGQKGRE